jgi:hypothetical protein
MSVRGEQQASNEEGTRCELWRFQRLSKAAQQCESTDAARVLRSMRRRGKLCLQVVRKEREVAVFGLRMGENIASSEPENERLGLGLLAEWSVRLSVYTCTAARRGAKPWGMQKTKVGPIMLFILKKQGCLLLRRQAEKLRVYNLVERDFVLLGVAGQAVRERPGTKASPPSASFKTRDSTDPRWRDGCQQSRASDGVSALRCLREFRRHPHRTTASVQVLAILPHFDALHSSCQFSTASSDSEVANAA